MMTTLMLAQYLDYIIRWGLRCQNSLAKVDLEETLVATTTKTGANLMLQLMRYFASHSFGVNSLPCPTFKY